MKYRIKIPKPCHENWQQMTAVEKGKFCNKCNKIVFDLTTLTDKQLISKMNQKESICGRVKSSQLNRHIETPSKNNFSGLATAVAVTASLLSTEPVLSQKYSLKQGEVVIVDSPKDTIKNKTIKASNLKVIKGNISDINTNLPGVSVLLKGTTIKTETDFDGNFSLEVSKDAKKNTILVISYLGYKTITLDISKIKQPLKINMEEDDTMMLGEVSVVAGMVIVEKPTLLQRIGSVFKKKEL